MLVKCTSSEHRQEENPGILILGSSALCCKMMAKTDYFYNGQKNYTTYEITYKKSGASNLTFLNL